MISSYSHIVTDIVMDVIVPLSVLLFRSLFHLLFIVGRRYRWMIEDTNRIIRIVGIIGIEE